MLSVQVKFEYPVLIDVEPDTFNIDIDALKKAITPKTKMMIDSSPCNPSGSVYSKEELRALADVLVKYPDIIVISDAQF